MSCRGDFSTCLHYCALEFWFISRNEKNVQIHFYEQLTMFYCMIISYTCDHNRNQKFQPNDIDLPNGKKKSPLSCVILWFKISSL